MRSSTRWLAGLVALLAACIGVTIWLSAWAAQLYHETDEFYRTSGNEVHPEDTYLYYDTIGRNVWVMQEVMTGLCAGAVLVVLALLAILAVRWDRAAARP